MWKVFHEKWLNSHIEREHQRTETQANMLEKPTMFFNSKRRKKETCASHHQSKIDNNNPSVSADENHQNFIIGPSNSGKT